MKTSFEQADLRVRRTHKLLWEALMAELSERAFEEITVKDICERAMVHRTTFYKHYEDKYALLEQGMRQMYDALVAEVVHAPPSAFSATRARESPRPSNLARFYVLSTSGKSRPDRCPPNSCLTPASLPMSILRKSIGAASSS